MGTVRSWSARPTLSGRAHLGPPHGYPGVTFPTVAPERFTVEPQHVFIEVLDRADAERLGFVPLFAGELFMFAGKLGGVLVICLVKSYKLVPSKIFNLVLTAMYMFWTDGRCTLSSS